MSSRCAGLLELLARQGVAVSTTDAVSAYFSGWSDRLDQEQSEGAYKLCYYAPFADLERCREAAFSAGAGNFDGHYVECSWDTLGTGRFRPRGIARPAVGQVDSSEVGWEYKVEITCSGRAMAELAADRVRAAHSYEVPVVELYKLYSGSVGRGAVSEIPLPRLVAPVSVFGGEHRVNAPLNSVPVVTESVETVVESVERDQVVESVESSQVENEVSRGKWYKKNKAKKQKKKPVLSDSVPEWRRKSSELQQSWNDKRVAENALAAEKARQQLELLKARDIEKVKSMQRAQVMRTTEVCKVQTEKAFGTLKRTGNVPGFAETVVSDLSLTDGSTARSNGECISPDSSVSQQEIRKMQQDLLEYEKKEADYKHMLRKVKEANPLLYDHVMRIGPLKTAFTLESDGGIPVEEFGEIRDDGKFHVAYPSADIITNKERARLEALGELHFPGVDDHEYLLGQAGGF